MVTLRRILFVSQLFIAFAFAAEPVYFAGTVTNTTNEKQPQTASAVFAIDGESCVVYVAAPLYGSGACSLVGYDKETGKIQLVSYGPLITIKWTGTVKDASVSGSYEIEYRGLPSLPERGVFQFVAKEKPEKPLKLGDVLASEVVKSGDTEFVVWLERDMLSVHRKDGTYAGRRVLLDQNMKPLVVIEDYANGSTYHLPDKSEALLEWVTDGKSGYYTQPNGNTKKYLDRFFQPTGWVSFEAGSQTIFGSAQEFVGTRILGRFLDDYEFGSGRRHALGLQQQVPQVFVAATPA